MKAIKREKLSNGDVVQAVIGGVTYEHIYILGDNRIYNPIEDKFLPMPVMSRTDEYVDTSEIPSKGLKGEFDKILSIYETQDNYLVRIYLTDELDQDNFIENMLPHESKIMEEILKIHDTITGAILSFMVYFNVLTESQAKDIMYH